MLLTYQFSQATLCRMTGISAASMSHYVSGSRIPTIHCIIKIADSLGISIDYLIFGCDDPRFAKELQELRELKRKIVEAVN